MIYRIQKNRTIILSLFSHSHWKNFKMSTYSPGEVLTPTRSNLWIFFHFTTFKDICRKFWKNSSVFRKINDFIKYEKKKILPVYLLNHVFTSFFQLFQIFKIIIKSHSCLKVCKKKIEKISKIINFSGHLRL